MPGVPGAQCFCGAHAREDWVTSVPESVILVRWDNTALRFSVFSFPVEAAEEQILVQFLLGLSLLWNYFSVYFLKI